MKKLAIIAFLSTIVLMPVSIFPQKMKAGFGLFNKYYINPLTIRIKNNLPFEISDYKSFGKGIENGEGRMRYVPVGGEEFKILPHFNAASLFVSYNRFKIDFDFDGLQNFLISYNFFENKHLMFGTHIGYSHTELFNVPFKDSYTFGHLEYVDGYTRPLYNGTNKIYYNGSTIISLDSKQHVFSTGIQANLRFGKEDWLLLFTNFSVIYIKSNLKYKIFSDMSLLKPGTYDEYIPDLKAETLGFVVSVGYYLCWGK